ncbi:hypothetical protein [Saccharothrix australiensis]|uniref:Uncharacterized protein n=1 Tax=Saccharothrix australiensis TaxID=2072 RepID=A0A495W2Y6_9PSEU|nr:hypothetical protein [Saccharothrix australiensis]RKT55407.1 hypothetical protein C8E97_4075 [Saccharothrix australiensis]
MHDLIGPEQVSDLQDIPASLQNLAVDSAPRVFAIGFEYDEPDEVGITAWGIAFHDHTQAFSTDGTHQVLTDQPHQALHHFAEADATMHLFWADPLRPDNHHHDT